jgi:hypothetical protein
MCETNEKTNAMFGASAKVQYFTDICSIAVVTLALFQRSVMDPEKMRHTNKKKTCDTAHTSHHN